MEEFEMVRIKFNLLQYISQPLIDIPPKELFCLSQSMTTSEGFLRFASQVVFRKGVQKYLKAAIKKYVSN